MTKQERLFQPKPSIRRVTRQEKQRALYWLARIRKETGR